MHAMVTGSTAIPSGPYLWSHVSHHVHRLTTPFVAHSSAQPVLCTESVQLFMWMCSSSRFPYDRDASAGVAILTLA
jgi:hypothetical protein